MSRTPSQPCLVTASAHSAWARRAILFTAAAVMGCASTSTLFEQSYAAGERTSEATDVRIDLRSTSYLRTGVQLELELIDSSSATPAAAPSSLSSAQVAGACMLWVDELGYPPQDPGARERERTVFFELSRPLRARAWLRCQELATPHGRVSFEMEIPGMPAQPREDLDAGL